MGVGFFIAVIFFFKNEKKLFLILTQFLHLPRWKESPPVAVKEMMNEKKRRNWENRASPGGGDRGRPYPAKN